MISKHKNVRMVFSRHIVPSSYHIDKGEKGNDIYQMLQDYQHEDFGAVTFVYWKLTQKINNIGQDVFTLLQQDK